MTTHTNPSKLTRSEIRRRIAQMPPSNAMVRQLLRVITALRKENAALCRHRRH